MKILLFLIGSFTFIVAKSQNSNNKINNNEFLLNLVTKNPVPSPHFFNAEVSPPATYKYLFQTEKGKVYQSPIDKMKCLAAEFPSKMPVAGIFRSELGRIPNPMLNNPAIPKSLNQKVQIPTK
ncbi:MAG: hypothetical protein ABI359_10755 [Ginsengibacter sp.]